MAKVTVEWDSNPQPQK